MVALAAMLKIYFEFLLNQREINSTFIGSIVMTCRSKVAKIVLHDWKSKMAAILKINIEQTSSLELKGQLTQTCLVIR